MNRAGVERRVENESVVLHPAEELDPAHVELLWAEANRTLLRPPRRIVLDLNGVTRVGVGGVALVRELEHRCQRRGVGFSVAGASPAVTEFLHFVQGRSPDRPTAPPARRLPGSIPLSRKAARACQTVRAFVEFVGRFTESVEHLVMHPREFRVRDVLYELQRAGAEGMWLIGGLSVLLGVIMAFQGLSSARGFGSPLLVADVVTLSTTREMAPLLTGVLVAGRSGAAIAAEIGTMKIDQELDALTVMGLDVTRFLLVPRTVALVIATPLLTLLSMAAGILGGAVVATLVVRLTPVAYFGEVRQALTAAQVSSALAKGAAFGLVAGWMACFHGLQAGKAAEDVGRQTTAAVVTTVLLIIAVDALFSITSEVYAW
jgi:phospholipid/cholesterol/gamma-HCH transport system permease protein